MHEDLASAVTRAATGRPARRARRWLAGSTSSDAFTAQASSRRGLAPASQPAAPRPLRDGAERAAREARLSRGMSAPARRP
jgi:hypothetical protein